MGWIQGRLCSLAWRILWRYWPERVYIAVVRSYGWHPASWEVVEAGTPSHPHKETIAQALFVREKLDHPGKAVKVRG